MLIHQVTRAEIPESVSTIVSVLTAWYTETRSAILYVPSYVARMDRNVIFNTLHPEYGDLEVSWEVPA